MEMKASEMENEELAAWVERIASACNVGLLDGYRDYLREAAARLRKTDADIAFANACADETSDDCNAALVASKGDVDDLRRRLRVAEDALEKITTGSFVHKDGDKPIVQVIIDIASNALSAIREEGDK